MNDLEKAMIYRQTLISDLIELGANASAIVELSPTTEQLEGLVAGLIKIKVFKP